MDWHGNPRILANDLALGGGLQCEPGSRTTTTHTETPAIATYNLDTRLGPLATRILLEHNSARHRRPTWTYTHALVDIDGVAYS
jgi:hypothetical protein